MTLSPAAQINLYDPALLPTPERWTTRNALMMVLAVLLSLVLWGGFAHMVRARLQASAQQLAPELKNAQTEVVRLAAAVAELKPDAQLEQDLEKARAVSAARGEVLDILKKGLAPEATSQADFLRGFARQSVPGLWLTSFVVNVDTGMLEIIGRTNDPALIPTYVGRLGEEKAFAGRTFAALNIVHSSTLTAAPSKESQPNPALAALPPAHDKAEPAPAALKQALFHEFKLNSAAPSEGESLPRVMSQGAKP